MLNKESITDYLINMNDDEFKHLMVSVRHERKITQDSNLLKKREMYNKRRKSYVKSKEQKEIRGNAFKETLKIGDIVKMEGTKDRTGIREIIELKTFEIVCRKINKDREMVDGKKSFIYTRGPYITTHYYSKVVRVLDITIKQ